MSLIGTVHLVMEQEWTQIYQIAFFTRAFYEPASKVKKDGG